MSQFFTFSPRAAALVRYTARNSPRWARNAGRLVRRSPVKIVRRYPLTSVATAGTVGQLIPTKAQVRAARQFVNSRKKRYTMRRVGERIGSGTTKKQHSEINYVTINPKVMYQAQLLNLLKDTTAGDTANQRQSEQVDFRGIKFCFNVRAEGALGTAKAWINIAIISPKANLTSAEAIPNAGFFRDPGSTENRSLAFDAASLNNLEYRCFNINTDLYNIHKRLRLSVGPSGSTEGHKERLIEFYMPVKRQIRYEVTGSNPSGKNMYLVYWFSASDNGAPANSIAWQASIIKYFRDAKH